MRKPLRANSRQFKWSTHTMQYFGVVLILFLFLPVEVLPILIVFVSPFFLYSLFECSVFCFVFYIQTIHNLFIYV